MTDSQLTQCPHCKASFKVSEEQLSAANGRVRCGACLNIFDAIAYRISGATKAPVTPTEFSDKPAKPASSNIASEPKPDIKKPENSSSLNEDFSFELDDAIDLEEEILHQAPKTNTPSEEEALFADDPDEDKLDKSYSGPGKLGDELSTSFLELDTSNQDGFKTQFLQDEPDILPDTDAIDESWTSSILDDLEEPTQTKREPSFSLDDTIDEPDTSQDIDHTSKAPSLEFEQQDLNALRFEYDQDPAPKRKWFVGSIFFLLNVALLTALIAQASWFHYEKLVKYPKLADAYERVCAKLGCELPLLSNVSKIENQSLVVRSHPTTFEALIIETIITNHANFEQDFPDISLTFSNINNQIVAQRLFTPNEYLNNDLLSWPGMPTNQPIQITLEIIDPGANAVNYQMNFHPPKSSNIDQEVDQLSTNKSKI